MSDPMEAIEAADDEHNDPEDESPNDMVSAVVDEIALEGLDGITLESLWIRLRVRYGTIDGHPDKRLDFASTTVQNFIFTNVIKDLADDRTVSFYCLPQPRPTIGLYNRYQFVNQENGTLIEDPDLIPDDIYGEVTPVVNQDVKGSSRDYHQRKNVTQQVINSNMTINDIDREFGSSRFVVVADQTHRTRALFGEFCQPDIELTPIQYCILERIGRQRHLGEITITKEAGHYKQTPKTLFYYRKLLLKKILIKKKICYVYNVKTIQTAHGQVLTLTRFASDVQSISQANAKRVNDMLLASEDREMDYDNVREYLQIRGKAFRQLIANYSSNFLVIPSPDESNKLKRILRLAKPIKYEIDDTDYTRYEDIDFGEEEDEVIVNSSKVQSSNIFNPSLFLADRTLLTQALAIVESFESSDGISMRQFGDCMSIPRLEARSLMKYLEKAGAVSSVMVDRGRQKVTMFIPKWKTQALIAKSCPTRDMSAKVMPQTKDNLTNRTNIILSLVQKEQLVDRIFTFKQLIKQSEKNSEYSVCNKTVIRIVNKLAAEGHVRSIKTVLTHEDRTKMLHFVCVPAITPDHPLVKERIDEMRFQWIGKNSCDIHSDKPVTYTDTKPKYLIDSRPKNNIVMNLVYQPSIARKYGLEPKMKKILTLYRYLFYLTYGNDKRSKKSLPNTDWRYNIEPLSDCSQFNVCTIGQIIPRMPLSVFVKIVWISHIIPGLQELIDDPVKVNMTLSQISPVILECLRYRRKYVFNISEALVGLTYLGLVETQYKEQTKREKTVITVKNKFSLITNKIQTNFDMKKMKDVEEFCEALQLHCFESCNDCSLDKRLFAHNLRNWTYTFAYKSKNLSANNRIQKISGAQESKKENKKRKHTKESSLPNKKKQKKSKVEANQSEAKRVETVANDLSVPVNQKKNIRKRLYDKIDLRAMSLLKKQRTDWTPEEDAFLLICKVVSVLLDPHSPYHICVNRNVIRDELHKYYPKVSNDKTALACGRRITYMLKNPTTRQNVIDHVGEFKQQLSITRPDVPRSQEQVWTEAYVKLLHQVLALMQSSRRRNDNSSGVCFNSLDDLFSKYNVIVTAASVLPTKGRLHEDPNNVVDIHVNVVTNVLLSSLLSKTYLPPNNNKEEENSFAQTLFRIYQRYPDSLIRSVVTKLNKYGVMTKVKKTTKENLSSLKSKNSSAPYRISQNFLFLMQTKYCLESLLIDHNLTEDTICIKDGKTGFDAAVVTSLFASESVRFAKEIPDNIVVLQSDCPLLTSTRSSPKNPMDPKTASRYALHLLRQHLHSKGPDRVQHSADYLNVNQCRITCTATDSFIVNINSFDNLFKKQKELFTDEFAPGGVRYCAADSKKLLQYIDRKRELGASMDELSAIKPLPALDKCLKQMTDKKQVFRVGVRTFRWVSRDYVNPWLVRSAPNSSEQTSEQSFVKFFARYWKQPNGAVDVKVMFKFLCAVLGHIMTNPCVPESKLIQYFDQSLQPVQLLELVELLSSAQCVQVIGIASDIETNSIWT